MTTLRRFLLRAALVAALLYSPPVAPAATGSSAVFAEGWGISRLFSGLNNRTRIIQFCVAAMALALFILIKKFAVTEASFPAPSRAAGKRPSHGAGVDVAPSSTSLLNDSPTR